MYNNRYKAKIPVATNRTEPQYRDQGIIKFLSRDITLQQVVDMVESEFIATRESIAIRWWLADHVIHLITDERPSQSTKWWLREVGDYIDGAISLQQVTDNLEIYARSPSPSEAMKLYSETVPFERLNVSTPYKKLPSASETVTFIKPYCSTDPAQKIWGGYYTIPGTVKV